VQTTIYPCRAYERATRSVMLLERQLSEMTADEIAAIPHIGTTALAIAREVLATGKSKTADTRVRGANRSDGSAEKRQRCREGFLSMAAARVVLNAPAGKAVGLKDYRGDFQMHSTGSDGHRSIGEMALAAIDRGYAHIAITDHSAGLAVTGGLTPASMRRQHAEIDGLNKKMRGKFKILKGIEANIRMDGSVDVAVEDRKRCDIVLAAPHSALDSDADQTKRLLAAIDSSHVHILAHGSGRKFGKRPGLIVDWRKVFARAAERNVAIEIDGDPSRQDVPYALLMEAHRAGCLFAIDSDAHDTGELVFSQIGLAHARLAGIPASRVINSWTIQKLLDWLLR
jgi:histidinol phosphatase-like PHP family hydrolase